jgi:hypothetical protein
MLMTLVLVLAAWTVLSFSLTVLVGRMISVAPDGPRPAEPAPAKAQVVLVRW